MHQHFKAKQPVSRGFTLVELMLAMAFFASILAISSATFVQILGVYNKGLAVKQMNQAGRTLTDSLLRNTSHGADGISVASGPNGARCIRLGATTYLLSYASEEASPPNTAYRFQSTGRPVNFVRYNLPNISCPLTTTLINPSDVSPVVDAALRVYTTDISTIGGGDSLLRFKLVLGTFTGDSSRDPSVSGGVVTCPADSLGNFCAMSSYETVLYLSNRQGGV